MSNKFVGKSKAMEMVLLGQDRLMSATEAERSGLVSRVISDEKLIEEALRTAGKICKLSMPILMMAKESVKRAYEVNMVEGVRFERRLFHSTFSTQDKEEGMAAFVEKRPPNFKDK